MERITQIAEKFGPFGQIAVILALIVTWQQESSKEKEIDELRTRVVQIETIVGELRSGIDKSNALLLQLRKISCVGLPKNQRSILAVCDD